MTGDLRYTAVITAGPAETKLTTVERVKLELGITDTDSDALLGFKIDEASSDIELHIPRKLSRVTLTETFWHAADARWNGSARCSPGLEFLKLHRVPVAEIVSVTLDGAAIDSSGYRMDSEQGLLYRLDGSACPGWWSWSRDIVIVHKAGFLLPGEQNRDLPAALESAAIELIASFWASRGRDPMVRAEENVGVSRFEYWVGAVGDAGDLPPSVMSKILPFRIPVLA
jgi:hypothetical protein